MTDDRPRPEYGEYATPEQQAAAMGRGADSLMPVAPPPAPEAPGAVLPQVSLARPSGYANRFFTIFLLGLGALTLFSNIVPLLDYATTLKGVAASEGLALTIPASVNAAGVPTLIANFVLYAITVLVSVRVLRRGHVAFYIPIIGWLVFGVTASVLLVIFAPAFVSQFAH